MSARSIKGLKGLRLFPVTYNDSVIFKVGTKVLVPGAVSLSLEPITSEFTQYADDAIYAKGADISGYNFTLEIAEVTPEIQELFEGGTYDTETGVYTFKTSDVQPENALSFQCLQADGNYKMVKVYSAVAQALSFSAKTKSDSTELQTVTITGVISARLYDEVLRDEKVGSDTTWLDTIAAVGGYTVTFTVKDASEVAVAGATVTIDGETGTTDETGVVTIANVSAGAQSYTVSKTGFTDATDSVTVDGAEAVAVTLTV